jgi:hypothetical protein
MSETRKMTWDELLAAMIEQRTKAEKAEAEVERLRGKIKSWVSRISEDCRYGGKPRCFVDMMDEVEIELV